ncbi:MAG: hypothetical protein ACI86H_002872 [bacterium]|jgi:hypothetical protein
MHKKYHPYQVWFYKKFGFYSMPPNITARKLYKIFHQAVLKRKIQAILQIIKNHPEVHCYDGRHGTIIEILSWHYPEAIEPSFQAGLNPDATPEGRDTFLQDACANGDMDSIQLALKYNADIDYSNGEGEVAFCFACTWSQTPVVELLLQNGADINIVEQRHNGFQNTPLDCVPISSKLYYYLRAQGAKHFAEL